MNKVMAAMMIMALTTSMPAMAGNKYYNDRNDKAVGVNNHKSNSHFDKLDRELSRDNHHKGNIYRPDVKTCTFKVGRHENYKKLIAKAENMKGVIDARWNSRTHEVIVRYDAKVTSARNIRHFMA
jgi:hypothetical protein